MPPNRILIDTDPGVDDGVALTMALRHPGVAVEAITVVQGNAALAHTVRNARLVTEVCGVDLPVYAGAHAPLVRPAAKRPPWIHGRDGFADVRLRPRRRAADTGFAPDKIVEAVGAAPGEISLVTLGPLTNVALALAREPRLPALVRSLVMLGGAPLARGNSTPVAEFNVHADPEAARLVLNAGFDITIVGIELCRGAARLTETDVAAIAALQTPAAQLVSTLLAHSLRVAGRRAMSPGEQGASCPDAVAMAIALEPSLLTESAEAHVDVELHGELTTGMTVVDWLDVHRRLPNARIGLALDVPGLKRLIVDLCS